MLHLWYGAYGSSMVFSRRLSDWRVMPSRVAATPWLFVALRIASSTRKRFASLSVGKRPEIVREEPVSTSVRSCSKTEPLPFAHHIAKVLHGQHRPGAVLSNSIVNQGPQLTDVARKIIYG